MAVGDGILMACQADQISVTLVTFSAPPEAQTPLDGDAAEDSMSLVPTVPPVAAL